MDHAALITLRFLKIYATLPDLADNKPYTNINRYCEGDLPL